MPAWLIKALPFLRGLLPMNKIAAWVVGVVLVVIAGIAGVKGEDVKKEFCSIEKLPESPKIEISAPAEKVDEKK
jgi:hypothetical protein